jgi:CxxC motif-containing protein (DUF1111 family)
MYFLSRNLFVSVIMGMATCLVMVACGSDDGEKTVQAEEGEELSGGSNFTTFTRTEEAFGEQGEHVTSAEEVQFVTGNSFFRSNWVTAPSSVTSLDGLGPIMNAISCSSCHFKDGRAKPPATPDEVLNGLLFRLSIPGAGTHGEPVDEPNYGGQFQDKAIMGADAEGTVQVTYEEITGTYADGTGYTLRKPIYTFAGLQYGVMDPSMLYSPRIAQQVPGLGLLEAVPESFIRSLEDAADRNGDGISGRVNEVWNEASQQITLGRFGWKANVPTVLQQTAGALHGDIGITSSMYPTDGLTPGQSARYKNMPTGSEDGAPEISDETLNKIVTYMKTLSVPARRNWTDATVLRGKQLFTSLQCAACHVPRMTTGTGNSITALDNQTIRPYTDLLLHDMGEGLADNRPDFLATGGEWRTPPLWGVGMIKSVNHHTFLLHDGRARDIAEAILWHGGEATAAKDGFTRLPAADRDALIKFIESL